jgi:hypothetical protein
LSLAFTFGFDGFHALDASPEQKLSGAAMEAREPKPQQEQESRDDRRIITESTAGNMAGTRFQVARA